MTDRFRLENVVRRYRERHSGQWVEALRVPHLAVAPGEIVAIVGPNGSGKSTLLELMACLAPPDSGRVWLDGRDVWKDDPLAARRRCPMLLQRTVLLRRSVLGNVLYGLRLRGIPAREAQERAGTVLRLLGLERFAHRGPRELSGGERQRVALARVLALEPDVLLLDEPTAHVDRTNQQIIEDALQALHARRATTIILSSHERQATRLAHRVLALADGQILPTDEKT